MLFIQAFEVTCQPGTIMYRLKQNVYTSNTKHISMRIILGQMTNDSALVTWKNHAKMKKGISNNIYRTYPVHGIVFETLIFLMVMLLGHCHL